MNVKLQKLEDFIDRVQIFIPPMATAAGKLKNKTGIYPLFQRPFVKYQMLVDNNILDMHNILQMLWYKLREKLF